MTRTLSILFALALLGGPLAAKSAGEILKENRKAIVNLRLHGWDTDDNGNWGEADWTCTGFVIDQSGTIATNGHCLDGATRGYAIFEDGSRLDIDGIRAFEFGDSKFRSGAPWWDVAVVQVPGFGLQTVALGNSDGVEAGDDIIVIGFPLQFTFEGFGEEIPTPNLTKGVVSSVRILDGTKQIGIDAAISGGNSGGPVFNDAGEVIGLATWHVIGGQNLNFVFPINYMRGLDHSQVRWPIDTWVADPTGSTGPGVVVDPAPGDPDTSGTPGGEGDEGLYIHPTGAFWFFPPEGMSKTEENGGLVVFTDPAGDYLVLETVSTPELGGADAVVSSVKSVVGDLRSYEWVGEGGTSLDGIPGTLLDYAYNSGANTGVVAIFADSENTVLVDLEPAARLGEVYDGLILFMEGAGAPEDGLAPYEAPDVPLHELAIGPPLGLSWGDNLWDADGYLEGGSWSNSYPNERGQPGDYDGRSYMEIYDGGEVFGVGGEIRLYYGDDMALVRVDFSSDTASSCTSQFEQVAAGARQAWGEPSDSVRERGGVDENLCSRLASGAEGIIYRDWWAGPGDWWSNQSQPPNGGFFVAHNGLVVGLGEMDGETLTYALWEHDSVLPAWGAAVAGSGPLAFGLDWGMDLNDVHSALTAEGLENRYPSIMGQAATDEEGYSGFPYLEVYDGAVFADWDATANFYFGDDRGLASMTFVIDNPAEGCGGVFAWILDDFTTAFGPPLSTPPHSASWGCGAGEWGDGAVAVWEDGVERIAITAGAEVTVTYEPF